MTKKHATIPAGTIITMTTDEYPNYSIMGVFRAIKDITHDDIMMTEKEVKDHYYGNDMYRYGYDRAFIDVLETREFIEGITSAVMHLGHYGRIEPCVSFTEDEE